MFKAQIQVVSVQALLLGHDAWVPLITMILP